MVMKLNISKKLGKNSYTFQVEGKNLYECLQESQRLSFPNLIKCALCESDDLYFTSYETKEDHYKYVKVVCNHCRASLTMGKSKDKEDTYFFRKNDDGKYDWKKYEPKEEHTEKTKAKVEEESDVPF